jgi:tyrosine-protein phosphatase YwqE
MMFFSRKKENSTADLSWIGTDMHSHLVPGIDDGSPDAATSLELIKGLQDLGFQRFITTPHILSDLYPNTPETIGAGLDVLKKAASDASLPVQVHAAAEYFIDEHFQQLLSKKTPLLTLSGNLVLVEFSMITAPMDLQDVLFELQLQNYQPVIAHPERYIYLSRRKEFFDMLRDAGAWFQLNLLSVGGGYGTSVQELAEYLLKKGYYELAGTDLHHKKHLEGLRKLGNSNLLNKLRDSGVLKNRGL